MASAPDGPASAREPDPWDGSRLARRPRRRGLQAKGRVTVSQPSLFAGPKQRPWLRLGWSVLGHGHEPAADQAPTGSSR